MIGLADSYSRLGNQEKAQEFFEKIQKDLKGTLYEKSANIWMETKTLAPAQAGCLELLEDLLVIHLGERLAQPAIAAEALVHVDALEARNEIEVPVATQQWKRVLPAKSSDPQIIGGDRRGRFEGRGAFS